jgi:hypothetical protein
VFCKKGPFHSTILPGLWSFFTLFAFGDKFSHPREYVESAAKILQFREVENGKSAQQFLSHLLKKAIFLRRKKIWPVSLAIL